MIQKIAWAAFVAALVVLVAPATVNAYGAAHVGYTHVGPNGVYHTGDTVARGPGGTYGTSHTTAYGSGGGAAYHSSSGAAYSGTTGAAYGTQSSSGYHYSPSYSGAVNGGAAYHSSSYGYVR